MKKTILDLCGGTGSWSKPYQEAGYEVVVITLPTQDVRDYSPTFKVHGIFAAPPCTHFSGSGAQYWPAKDKDGRTADSLSIVDACLRIIKQTNPVWWAVENPVGRLKKLRYDVLGEPRLLFHPCDYGDPYTKKTLVWGNLTEPLKNPVKPYRSCTQGSWLQKLGGSSERTKLLRSITPPGFAQAFFKANP